MVDGVPVERRASAVAGRCGIWGLAAFEAAAVAVAPDTCFPSAVGDGTVVRWGDGCNIMEPPNPAGPGELAAS